MITGSAATHSLRRNFVDQLKKSAPHLRPQKPRPEAWLATAIGRSGFSLNLVVNSREERMRVELWITGSDAKTHFAKLSEQKAQIEEKLGFELDWQELPDSQACRLACWYHQASIANEAQWSEYIAWLSKRLGKMDQVLRPIVRNLP